MPDQTGALFVIGGAEDKLKRRTILRHFIESSGGADARIAVVPTASSLGPEVVEIYAALFTRLGAAAVIGVRPESRDQANDPTYAALLDDATGIFMTGGNQLKLSAIISLAVRRLERACSRPIWSPSVSAVQRQNSG